MCRKRTLVADELTGNTVCTLCGLVQKNAVDNLHAQIGGINGDIGSFISLGTGGSGTVHNYRETKIYHAENLIDDFLNKLSLSRKRDEVKDLIKKVTDGEYGQGEWFSLLVGACAYVVMRNDHNMVPIVEVANLLSCDVYDLGRMISRVVDFADLKLSEFDIVNAFERVVRSFVDPRIPKDVVDRMLQQGVFLMQCLIKWFVTTGRRPMPVVAAVLVFVAELNQVDVKIEDVAIELLVATATCKLRYKELLERLVEVARSLPWGKDVTVKNIMKNAPCVIKYMEMKSMTECSRQKQSIEHFNCDVEGLVGDCLRREIEYGYTKDDCSSKYFELDDLPNSTSDYPDKFQISHESLTMIYSNYLEECSAVEATAEIDLVKKRGRQKMVDPGMYTEWWEGKSDLSKRLILKKILEKDVGFDARPPSFERACKSKAMRQEKIKAAKLRIGRIMNPRVDCSDLGLVEPRKSGLVEPEKARKKRKKLSVDIDWEDLIIETLLLHGVKEEEIEKGHYNVLLELHVFHHGIA